MTSTWNVGRQSAAQKMVALQGDEEDENIFIYTKLVKPTFTISRNNRNKALT